LADNRLEILSPDIHKLLQRPYAVANIGLIDRLFVNINLF
jgi:hypothetical protein